MNVSKAALLTGLEIYTSKAEEGDSPVGKSHLFEMTSKIISGQVTGEKAHRWLGYIQGVLVASGSVTLEQVKKINKRCKVKK